MNNLPSFESVAIVSDKPRLAAEIASLFKRPKRYLAVIDGPRMGRPDASNEVVRRHNTLASVRPRRILLAGLSPNSSSAIAHGIEKIVTSVETIDDAVNTLKGCVKRPQKKMQWGCDNLGVGLLLSRHEKAELLTTSEPSPTTTFVPGGKHLLIVCEAGEALAEISSSCLAFATNAAFLVIPKLPKEKRDAWLEEIYSLESGGDVSARFLAVRDRARQKLGDFPFNKYKRVLFVTSGFPWGISIPECITSHMYNYPDFGRCMVGGLWAAQDPARTARNALLVDPQKVLSSEVTVLTESFVKNGTLVRVLSGKQATVLRTRMLIDTLPFDIIAFSTHAGDASGVRSTYEYVDDEGINRRLVVDEAIGVSYDPMSEKYEVQQFIRFHELDGVNWADPVAKSSLYVGSAINSWVDISDLSERNKYKVAAENIPRVAGSMALKMFDNIWIPIFHGLAPESAPLVFNNACSSWHELGNRFMFAGARGYIGTLFPVTDPEAQEIGRSIFETHLMSDTPEALWESQNEVYGAGGSERRPYAMFGLPWCAVRRNTHKSASYMVWQYQKAIGEYTAKSTSSVSPEIRGNCLRFVDFLKNDFQLFLQYMGKK